MHFVTILVRTCMPSVSLSLSFHTDLRGLFLSLSLAPTLRRVNVFATEIYIYILESTRALRTRLILEWAIDSGEGW